MNENTKEAYKQKIQAKIQEWEGQLEQLRNKANSVSADVKVEISKRIDELQNQKDGLKKKLESAGDMAGGAWDAHHTWCRYDRWNAGCRKRLDCGVR